MYDVSDRLLNNVLLVDQSVSSCCLANVGPGNKALPDHVSSFRSLVIIPSAWEALCHFLSDTILSL